MSASFAICRVVIVVLDGLRPDAIDAFALSNIREMALNGASTMSARTVSPSCTWPAMTSLMSGVSPETHGILRDSAHVPKPRTRLLPLPALVSQAGYHTAIFMRRLPTLYRGTARLITKRLGFAEAHFVGTTAQEVMMSAAKRLRPLHRGLTVIHLADADQAGESHGWMTKEYGEACRRLDEAVALLTTITAFNSDPETLVIALADHGGGGVTLNDHSEEHPLNWTIPLMLGGGSVRRMTLDQAHLLDVPATAAWALGVSSPDVYVGRALAEAIVEGEAGAQGTAAVA